jgi:hypothetical protein
MFLWIYADLVLLMGLVYWVTKPRIGKEVQEEAHHMRCPKCKQKIRFVEKQIGNSAKCPRCKLAIVLIPDDELVSESGGTESDDRFWPAD